MLRIKGGKVYHSANNVNGEVRDVFISGGRIVSHIEGGLTLDAVGITGTEASTT
jgi:formylmethanofuran dehydrogenase subunit A